MLLTASGPTGAYGKAGKELRVAHNVPVIKLAIFESAASGCEVARKLAGRVTDQGQWKEVWDRCDRWHMLVCQIFEVSNVRTTSKCDR